MPERLIGHITHYFGKISVGIVKLTDELKVGDKIRIKGAHTDFTMTVKSMQIEHENIDVAKPGDEIGLKVDQKVREKDEVYLVTDS
ncbi:translation elongation factor-like protein [candidate division WOR-3 bacterium]|uniref:Translation elongation factor-like protein n=1 Tax=candidate division WOR-3 bacterium TaxID=2052148 RepID=A0A660SLK3_UNCW3|nr:MAG: translation elongation factor-like protein [candidate division WOR-3 bacterium]